MVSVKLLNKATLMNKQQATTLSKNRLMLGGTVFIVGFPGILMLVSDGYRFLKEKLWVLLKKTTPSAKVSRPRYITGLVLSIDLVAFRHIQDL